MSELTNTGNYRGSLRWRLLTTTSALTLLTYIAACPEAGAVSDSDRPTVWIELGTQLERVDGGQQQFVPAFIVNSPRASVWNPSPISVERLSRYAIGGETRVFFEPAHTNWVFSAGVRYGRSNGNKAVSQQTALPTTFSTRKGIHASFNFKVGDSARGTDKQTHTILDFQAGKDIGLGAFGGKSVVNFGVRFAQFNSKSSVTMKSRPTLGDAHPTSFGVVGFYYPHNYDASADNTRSFHGIGPSISWDASASLTGNSESVQFTADWGLNAALLFGRQRVRSHHQTSGTYASIYTYETHYNVISSYHHTHNRTHSRSVIVPNVGGFAGVSLKFPNAKVSVGYRADFFFGAMDGGLDERKTYNRDFYGPFATISIGLGG